MIYIRDEGEEIRFGLNFYPLKSMHFGVVMKIFSLVLWIRYNKLLRIFKIYKS